MAVAPLSRWMQMVFEKPVGISPIVPAALVLGIGLVFQSLAYAQSKVPLQMVRGVHPVLAVTLDGHTQARMLIDSGAARTLVAPGLVARGTIVDLCLAEAVCVNDLPVDSYPSTYSSPKPGYYNGLIGWDVLSRLVTLLNYNSATVQFGISGGGSTLSFSLDEWGRPQAPVAIGGQLLENMLLDTGSSYVRVTDGQVQKLGSAFLANDQEVSLTMGAPETTTLSAPISVCAGSTCADNVVLQKARWPAVGGTFFRNFTLTIDGPAGAFRLAPVTAGPLVNSLQRYGLQLSPDNAREILMVSNRSPAAIATITTADQILSISGASIESLGYFGAMALLEDITKTSIELVVQGSGTARQVTLTAVPQNSNPGRHPHQQRRVQ